MLLPKIINIFSLYWIHKNIGFYSSNSLFSIYRCKIELMNPSNLRYFKPSVFDKKGVILWHRNLSKVQGDFLRDRYYWRVVFSPLQFCVFLLKLIHPSLFMLVNVRVTPQLFYICKKVMSIVLLLQLEDEKVVDRK